MIKPLPNPDYLKELLKRIGVAKTSVVVVNYLAEIAKGAGEDDPVLKVALALIEARRRGAKVQVFLEGLKLENNYRFYRMLKDAGVDVWMDTSLTFVHSKVVVIDKRIIFVGSHNLTRAALTGHEEYSIVTDDNAVIKRFEKEILRVSRQRDRVRGDVCRKVVKLPEGFMGGLARGLVRSHAGNAFDLCLMLFASEGKRGAAIPIETEKWCDALGFDPKKIKPGATKEYIAHYRMQRLNRILYQLKKLGFIEIDRELNAVRIVRSKTTGLSSAVEVPVTYWSKDLPHRLSFPAKYFYLICLTETPESPFYPWWKKSIEKIIKTYGGDTGSTGRAVRELEAQGILEVLRATPVKRGESYTEEAQFYRLNPVQG